MCDGEGERHGPIARAGEMEHVTYKLGSIAELEGHDISVNVVCATAVDTDINAVFGDAAWSAEAARLVGAWNLFQDEMMHEREITEAVLWLASRENAPMSGSTLMVDAGCMAK